MPGSTYFRLYSWVQFMENNKVNNEGCKKVKHAGPKPVGTAGMAIDGAAAMPSSSNAMTMSGTSNNNEVSEVPVPTARDSTEKACSCKQIPERIAEKASGSMSMPTETSSNSTPKGRSLESNGNVNSEAPGCSNRITYSNAYKILQRDAMDPNGRETDPKRRTEVEWPKGIIPDF